jgi:hypothetical protein
VKVAIIIVACEFSLAHVVMEYVDLKLGATAIPVNALIVKRRQESRLNLLILRLHSHRQTAGRGDHSHVRL